jgi:hypothetical protein
MSVIICPGMHQQNLTESFLSDWLSLIADSGISLNVENILVFPEQGILTLSAFHILQFLHHSLKNRLESPVIFISFSAGVVGAIIAAMQWQVFGGHVKAFIAIDGWGMPLGGNFPIHRLSHDYFTHWSSASLSSGKDNFYAEPPVDHLSMWRSPQKVMGYWVDSSIKIAPRKNRLNAAEFLALLIKYYEEK